MLPNSRGYFGKVSLVSQEHSLRISDTAQTAKYQKALPLTRLPISFLEILRRTQALWCLSKPNCWALLKRAKTLSRHSEREAPLEVRCFRWQTMHQQNCALLNHEYSNKTKQKKKNCFLDLHRKICCTALEKAASSNLLGCSSFAGVFFPCHFPNYQENM